MKWKKYTRFIMVILVLISVLLNDNSIQAKQTKKTKYKKDYVTDYDLQVFFSKEKADLTVNGKSKNIKIHVFYDGNDVSNYCKIKVYGYNKKIISVKKNRVKNTIYKEYGYDSYYKFGYDGGFEEIDDFQSKVNSITITPKGKAGQTPIYIDVKYQQFHLEKEDNPKYHRYIFDDDDDEEYDDDEEDEDNEDFSIFNTEYSNSSDYKYKFEKITDGFKEKARTHCVINVNYSNSLDDISAELYDYHTRDNYFTVKVKNNTMYDLYAFGQAVAYNYDYKVFDRGLYFSKGKEYIAIKPGKTKYLHYKVKGNNTWYDYDRFYIKAIWVLNYTYSIPVKIDTDEWNINGKVYNGNTKKYEKW